MPHKKKHRPFTKGDLVLINYKPGGIRNKLGRIKFIFRSKSATYGLDDLDGYTIGTYGKENLTHIQ